LREAIGISEERICQQVMLEEASELKVNRGQESNARGEDSAVGTDLALCDEFPFRSLSQRMGAFRKHE
jgi:hypothetical protein